MNVKKFNKWKCQPCFTRSIKLCCKQLKTCSTFQSAFNKNTFLIRHNVTCKSSCVIYLMECSLCEKSQYVGKSEYSLNLRMNTHRNDVWRTDGQPCDKHFQIPGHNLMFTLSLLSLKRFITSHYQSCKFAACYNREKIFKLQTLSRQGLNISLNYLQDTTVSIW